MSVRRQLLMGLLLAAIACVLGAGALMYQSLLEETNELADLQLRQLAVAAPNEFGANTGLPSEGDPEEEFVLQMWNADGSLAYVSPGWTPIPRFNLQGMTTMEYDDEAWRMYGAARNGRYIQVAQPMAERDKLARRMALRAGIPVLGGVLVFGLLVLLVVSRALRPLHRLAQAVTGQSPQALAPIADSGMPPELRPVVQALNALMGRFEAALAAQRTFVADAAHELRSPLTALRLQLQLLARAPDQEARLAALDKMHDRLERASHLVQQLLTLARHEAGVTRQAIAPVSLQLLLEQVVSDHSDLADSRDIDLGVLACAPVVLQADGEALRVLLNNLVDNALRYTQRGGRVDLQAELADGGAVLRVMDNGPGVAPEHRERLFDRFYRPVNDGRGCGLGLSIVRNIADAHGARVTLEDNAPGLRVSIIFPNVRH
ncbi:ATP-binding protein [Oxalobacteraceae bacterium A2-2]